MRCDAIQVPYPTYTRERASTETDRMDTASRRTITFAIQLTIEKGEKTGIKVRNKLGIVPQNTIN